MTNHRLRIIEELIYTVLDKLDLIETTLGDQTMSLDRIEAAVTRVEGVNASVVALINQLADEVRNAAPTTAALAALADRIDAQSDALAAAVTANTPV